MLSIRSSVVLPAGRLAPQGRGAAAPAAPAASGVHRLASAPPPHSRPTPSLSRSSRHAGEPRQQQLARQQQRAPQPACAAAHDGSGGDARQAEQTPPPAALMLFSSDDEPVPPYDGSSLTSATVQQEASSSSRESNPDAASSSGSLDSSDSEAGTVRIDLQLPRRSLLVAFTCNVCGGRSERLVNPVAWNKGMVIAKCQNCPSWHKLADAANLVEEIRYADLEDE